MRKQLVSRMASSALAIASLRLVSGHTDETEFLPAAIEIAETPPSPTGRIIAGTISLFLALALLWACLGSVDIIATAPGKIVPTGRTKVIQPMEPGVIHAIRVQDGQKVKTGDVLIEIDTTVSAAERDRLKSDAMQSALDMARLKAALEFDSDEQAHFVPPEGATEAQVALQKNILASEVDGIHAKLSDLDHQIAQNTGNRDAVVAMVAKLTQTMPFLEKRADALEKLNRKGYGSKLEYLKTQQDLVEHQQELQVQKGRLAEAEEAIASHKSQRQQAEDDYRRTTMKDLAEAEQKSTSLNEQLLQAAQKYRLQTLTAPVDGTVQQLAIHTEGGVVTPAQMLMSIVPTDSHLEIEAMVSNRDIGFVHAGEDAEIKIDTFNFTRYGLLHGKVQSVSQDAIERQKPAEKTGEKPQSGDEGESSEPEGQELVYAARISLDKTQMRIDDRLVNLGPGMAVTIEIKTGSRRVIEYLLSPLMRHKQQAMREQ